MGRDILKMKKVEKVDSVDEKRVELHLSYYNEYNGWSYTSF